MARRKLVDRFHDLRRDLRDLIQAHGYEKCVDALHEVIDDQSEKGEDFDVTVAEGLMAALAEISGSASRLRRIVIVPEPGARIAWSWEPSAGPPSEAYSKAVLASIIHALDPEADNGAVAAAMLREAKRAGMKVADAAPIEEVD